MSKACHRPTRPTTHHQRISGSCYHTLLAQSRARTILFNGQGTQGRILWPPSVSMCSFRSSRRASPAKVHPISTAFARSDHRRLRSIAACPGPKPEPSHVLPHITTFSSSPSLALLSGGSSCYKCSLLGPITASLTFKEFVVLYTVLHLMPSYSCLIGRPSLTSPTQVSPVWISLSGSTDRPRYTSLMFRARALETFSPSLPIKTGLIDSRTTERLLRIVTASFRTSPVRKWVKCRPRSTRPNIKPTIIWSTRASRQHCPLYRSRVCRLKATAAPPVLLHIISFRPLVGLLGVFTANLPTSLVRLDEPRL